MASSAFLFSASLHLRLTHWQVTGRKVMIKTLDRPAEDSSLEYTFNRLHIASSSHWEYWFSRSSGDLNARSSWIRLRRSSSRFSSSESESPSTPPFYLEEIVILSSAQSPAPTSPSVVRPSMLITKCCTRIQVESCVSEP